MDTNTLSPEEKARMSANEAHTVESPASAEAVESASEISPDKAAAPSVESQAAIPVPVAPKAPETPALTPEAILAGGANETVPVPNAEVSEMTKDHVMGNAKVENPAEAVEALIKATKVE